VAVLLESLLVFLAVFVAVLTAMRLFAIAGPLTRLSRRYPAAEQPEGQVYAWQTMGLGAVKYKNSVTVCISRQGLYLAVEYHARPALVPWAELKRARPTRLYWRPAVALTIGAPAIATITVYEDLYQAMRRYMSV